MNRTETRKLMCQLTEHEVMQRGEEMAKTYIQVAALDMEKKRITAKIKPLDERIEELVTIIDSKEEERDVECRWVPDWTAGIKSLIRNDTGEEVEFKKLQEWERQQNLPLRGTTAEEAANPNYVCPKCDGDGQYIEDGIEGGGGEVYCDCPAGIALKEKEEGDAGQQEKTGPEAAEEELETGCADAGVAGDQVKLVCQDCKATHPNCDDCCGSCHRSKECNSAQFCTLPGVLDNGTLCAVCVGLCGDYTPGTFVSECPGFCAEISEEQIARRDKTCPENWRECEFATRCFSPANEEGDDAACDCLKGEAEKEQAQAEDQKAGPIAVDILIEVGFSRNAAKLLMAGFSLVSYEREAKTIYATAPNLRDGWIALDPFTTYAQAERALDRMLEDPGVVAISRNKKGSITGGAKHLHGFTFYRSEGIMQGHGTPRIKMGPNWTTWKKFDNSEECAAAWEHLLQNDPKALED